MSQQLPEEWFTEDSRVNAAISWLIVAVLVVAAIRSLLAGLFVSLVIAAVAAAVAIVPALVARSWTRTVPWPLLLLASSPLVLAAFEPTFFRDLLVGLSVSALGMLVVVALQLTTTVRMTPGFAVAFVALATLSVAGFWAVGSAASAAYLGTAFVATNDELMYLFTEATVAGVLAGLAFRWYFRRQLRLSEQLLASGEVETA